ncbi:MAG TPA: hypothetical protein VH481_06565 [Nitrososphaeraceae archaeon]
MVILVILAVIGLGLNTFFGGVKKGIEKIGNLPEVKNLTSKAKNDFGRIIGNSTLHLPQFSKKM